MHIKCNPFSQHCGIPDDGLALSVGHLTTVVTPEQRLLLDKQRRLFLQQAEALRLALKGQLQLTGQDVLADVKEPSASASPVDVQPAAGSDEDVKAQPVLPAPEAPKVALPVAVTSPGAARLTPEMEQKLLAIFALQDTLTKDEAWGVAAQVGCQEEQVRTYFTKLRSSVRSFIQRMQRKASGKPTGSHASPAAPGVPAGTPAGAARSPGGSRSPAAPKSPKEAAGGGAGEAGGTGPGASEAAIANADADRRMGHDALQRYLATDGGLAEASLAGPLATMMAHETSIDVRSAILSAILRTVSAETLARLTSYGQLHSTLEQWVCEGEADRQTTFLHLLLQVLAYLPMALPMLSGSNLAKSVGRLQKYRSTAVAKAAVELVRQWRMQDQGGPSPDQRTKAPKGPQPLKPALKPSQPRLSQPGGHQTDAASTGPLSTAVPHEGASGLPLRHAAIPEPMVPRRHDSFERQKAVAGALGAGAAGKKRGYEGSMLSPAALTKQGSFEDRGMGADVQPGGSHAGRKRMRAGETSSRPLSADEIVKARAKRTAGQSSARGSGPLPKTSRLDFSSPAASADRRGLRAGLQGSHVALSPRSQAAHAPPFPFGQQQTAMHGTGSGGQAAVPTRGPALADQLRLQRLAQAAAAEQFALQSAQLQARHAERAAEELAASAEAVQRLGDMQADARLPFPPAELALPYSRVPPAAGEESMEREIQGMRNLSEPEAVYMLAALIPDSAAEAWEDATQWPAAGALPFVPTDAGEAAEQNTRMLLAGVLLPDLVTLDGRLTIPCLAQHGSHASQPWAAQTASQPTWNALP
ncbi:hypothetical protein WJX72_009093 [[Myrmecia] bisecta]|uniref:TFIIS N-terminal domain-containing protein n=1 Tax=[Myrmecia] bisecta TaxID=41462 RepID=A0AAW1R8N2_9CHLO